MRRILILNTTYEPLVIVSWKRAIRMLFQDKVEVLAEYDLLVRSVSLEIKLPSVVRLRQYVKNHRCHYQVKFTRSNLYARDGHRCQYCGSRGGAHELTYDHVIPVSQGGPKSWENIVTCCIPCNRAKADRTPEQAGLRLLKRPKAPIGFPQKAQLVLSRTQAPESWRAYIFG